MRALISCLALLSVFVAPSAMAQGRGLEVEYAVKVADIPGQLFHVTTDIKNINQPALDLSLPVWSPGWYVIENYAKNVFRFRVTEPGGREAAARAGAEADLADRHERNLAPHRRVRLPGERALRESGAHRGGLRVLHRHTALPSAGGSSIEAEPGAV